MRTSHVRVCRELSRGLTDVCVAFGLSCTNDSYTTQAVLGYVGARLSFHLFSKSHAIKNGFAASGQEHLLQTVKDLEVPPTTQSPIGSATKRNILASDSHDDAVTTDVTRLPENTRDMLLEHACRMYELPTDFIPSRLAHKPLVPGIPSTPAPELVFKNQVLPLLSTLDESHLDHCPTLLLLGCVYFSLKEYTKALETFERILVIYPTCVCPIFPLCSHSHHSTLGGSDLQ